MAYIKINGVDFSHICSGLKVAETYNYSAQTNAAGNTVVDVINKKRVLDVAIIPLDDTAMRQLLTTINSISAIVEYREPRTGELGSMIAICPTRDVEYYMINANRLLYKEIELTFTEL